MYNLNYGDRGSRNGTKKFNVICKYIFLEAIAAILLHNETSEDVLFRKKITAQILMRYLHNNSVNVGKSTVKHDLIAKCIEFWMNSEPAVPSEETETIQPATTSQVRTVQVHSKRFLLLKKQGYIN